ncbi:uncharacterized protein LOC135152782 [Daucus carota subsp. sativus]|uniref:uncharacterized protein LOC135152782 n=1 Tax=Daucus carota subsp. sativus TaxID=79200 RepID=UPI0030827CE4
MVGDTEEKGISPSLTSSTINNSMRASPNGKSIEDSFCLMQRHSVDLLVEMTIYANGIPFNVLRSPDFIAMVGDGNLLTPDDVLLQYGEDAIVIPADFCDTETSNTVENLIKWTYSEFSTNYKSPKYISERAILTPTNNTVGHHNSVIVDTIPDETFSYFRSDKVEEFRGTASDLNLAFSPEYLHSLNVPGLPLHEMKLKVGVAVMLMRNLNQTLGLCNRTRMMVTKCMKYCVQCEVICGAFFGTRHFIPRMELFPTETKLPFKLIRK